MPPSLISLSHTHLAALINRANMISLSNISVREMPKTNLCEHKFVTKTLVERRETGGVQGSILMPTIHGSEGFIHIKIC